MIAYFWMMNAVNMSVRQISEYIKKELKGFYDQNEIQQFVSLILEHFLQVSRIDVVIDPDRIVPDEKIMDIKEAISQLHRYRPVQYILGSTEFCGLRFSVSEKVLIPRPETEELVDWIIQKHGGQPLRILDIGTGSGCIAISLAVKMPSSRVTAIDISQEAIRIARKNAKANQAYIDFHVLDILNPVEGLPGSPFDLVVSNPPYVTSSEKAYMRKNVLDYEPHQALFVPDEDPKRFYSAIINRHKELLSPGGYLYFEINERCYEEIVALMKNDNFAEIELRKDIHGKYRMVSGRRTAVST